MGTKIKFYNQNILNNLDFTNGKFKLIYNLYKNILGSKTRTLYIDEISRSRKEVKLKPSSNALSSGEWINFNDPSIIKTDNYILNCQKNITPLIVNWIFVNDNKIKTTEQLLESKEGSYILKLYEPLPREVNIKDEVWVSKQIINSIEAEHTIIREFDKEKPVSTLQPNFNIEVGAININTPDYKSWDTVLNADSTTSQNIINTYLSQSSLDGIELNVDYSNYENFIHFSNAQTRIENFYYKMQLLELYTSQSSWYSSVSQSETQTTASINIEQSKINNILNGFDGFEKYLYYKTGSIYTDSYGDHEVSPWPKMNNYIPYINYSPSSSEALSWYSTIISSSIQYDKNNVHQLKYTLPEQILYNDYNDEYITFLNMIGQFFDIHWLYINRLEQLYERENKLNDGLSKKLIEDTVRSFGVDLVNGRALDNLWEYTIGSNSTGSYISTGSLTNPLISVPTEDLTYEVWNRILNNLPYLLKTKGTKRGIVALLNCYGIPSTILKIREYGGPQISGSADGYSHYDFKSLNHALKIESTNYITSSFYPNSIKPKAVELRFKVTGSGIYSDEPLLSWNGILSSSLYLQYSGSTKGWLVYEDSDGTTISSSVAKPYFDGNFWNIMIGSGSQFYIYSNQTNGSTINYSEYLSGSVNSESWESNTVINIGSGSFVGSIQEFRLWNTIPSIYQFNNHSKYIRSINIENSISSSYNNLLTRYTFDDPINHGSSGQNYVSDVKQIQSWVNNGNCVGYSNTTVYPYNYEYYTQDMSATTPILGIANNTNKIRIDSSSLINKLDPNISVEKSEFDLSIMDSNKIGIHYSPTEIINLDIIAQYADFNFDDFIGDPSYMWEDSYDGLREANIEYWKKYDNANNYWDYIKIIKYYDQSLNDIIKKMVPARSVVSTGVMIEPHILERSKRLWKTASFQDDTLTTTIQTDDIYIITSSYNVLNGSIISTSSFSASGESTWTDSTIGELSASAYNGAQYTYYNVTFSSSYTEQINPYWVRDVIQGVHYMACNFQNTSSNVLNNTSSFTPIYDIYITGSNYSTDKSDVIGNNIIGYDENHFIHHQDQSIGWTRARYDGCIQTTSSTIDLKPPVEEYINEQNRVYVTDDGKIKLRVE